MVTGFGDLDPAVNMRLAALAALGMALGVQSITAGFLIGLVRRVKRASDAAAAAPAGDTKAETEASEQRRRVG